MTKIRRVPLDFDWPLQQVWHGFVRPQDLQLPACSDCCYDGRNSTGMSAAANAISETFYAHEAPESLRSQIAWFDKITQHEVDMLLRMGRLLTWAADPETGEKGWQPLPRTATEVNASQHTYIHGTHDAINRWHLVTYRCKRLRIDMNCPTCHGQTHLATEEQKKAHKAWKSFDPPTGEGWQVWDDISEGSPISRVFGTREALVDWLTSPHSRDAYHRFPLSLAQAEAMVDAGGSIGSFIGTRTADGGGVLIDGDRAVHALSKNDAS